MKTILTHRACGTPIFLLDTELRSGDRLPLASEIHPLNPDWPQPRSGDQTRCPNCGAGFAFSDQYLNREFVDVYPPEGDACPSSPSPSRSKSS